jgi:hypothetical protein
MKPKDAQVPHTKWHGICVSPTHILPHTVSHCYFTYNANTVSMLINILGVQDYLGTNDKEKIFPQFFFFGGTGV